MKARERDYTYGATMLTLRTAIGLTQAGLADHLGVSRRAVGEWEVGSSYPKAEHLRALIILGVKHQAWPKGCEAGEIRALWKAAHQKVLLDERWLASILSPREEQIPALVKLLTPDGTATEDYIFLDMPHQLTGRYVVRARERDGREGMLIYGRGHKIVFVDADETHALHVFLAQSFTDERVFGVDPASIHAEIAAETSTEELEEVNA